MKGPDAVFRELSYQAHIRAHARNFKPDDPGYPDAFGGAIAALLNEATPEERTAYHAGAYITLQQEIAARLYAERQADRNYELAVTDYLTGLPMRRKLREVLAESFAERKHEQELEAELAAPEESLTAEARARLSDRREPEKKTFSVLFLDLRGFKKVNDDYGHAAGDEALKEVARVLQASVREGDLIARYGGDEFVVVLRGADKASHKKIQARVQDNFADIWVYSEKGDKKEHIRIDTGVGIADVQDDDTMESIIKRADLACEASKRDGMTRDDYVLTTLPDEDFQQRSAAPAAPRIIFEAPFSRNLPTPEA